MIYCCDSAARLTPTPESEKDNKPEGALSAEANGVASHRFHGCPDDGSAPPFVCGITREMPEKPVELIECGHLFDQDALRHWRAAGKTRCPECGGALDSRPSSVVAASLRAYRARSRRDAAVERDDVVVAKGRPFGRGSHGVVKKATWRGNRSP